MVIAVPGAVVSPTASVVVVVACETVTLVAEEVLAAKAAAFVGVKTAVSELAPSARAVVAKDADPELTLTGLPSATPPTLKVTVPAADEGDTVAVIVTLTP